MGQNLTGKLISNTYSDLVQISGSILTDGLGVDITSLDVTVSDAITAQTASSTPNAVVTTSQPADDTLSFEKGDGTSVTYQINNVDNAVDAQTAISASYAQTASFALNVPTISTGSFVTTASIVDATTTYTKADGSTFALTTNNVSNAISASYATTADSATTATSASHALNADNAISSSYAVTASFALNATDPFPYTGDASIVGQLQVTGSATIQSASFNGDLIDNLTTPTASDAVKHVVAISSEDYAALLVVDPNTFYIINDITGSLILGDTIVSGSLTVTGALNAPGLIVPSASYAQTASLAFFADAATSASYALTASYLEGGIPTTFPFTGSAGISGSLDVVGPITSGDGTQTVGTNGNEVCLGGNNNSATGNKSAVVGGEYHNVSGFRAGNFAGEENTNTGTNTAALGGYGNTVGGTYGAFAGGTGNNIGGTSYFVGGASNAQGSGFVYAILGGTSHDCQTDNTVIAGGNNNQTVSGHRDGGIFGGQSHILNGSDTDRSVILGGDNHLVDTNAKDAAILGGSNNIVSHSGSVVIGGDGLVSTDNHQVVVPKLLISGSGGGVTFPDGTTQTTAVSNPFPFTGTASISGSLEVTGSIGGILTDGEDIIIYATQSANNLVPNILIGAQDPAQNGLNTGIGYNNVVLGTGEFITDIKGLASGSGNSNAILGGFAGYIGRGNYNTIAGGGKNTIASGSTLLNGQAATYNFMGGGSNNIIGERSINTAVVGGTNHEILPIGTNGSLSSGIFAGTNVVISGSDYAGAFAARDSNIIFGNQAVIIGGDDHNIIYGSATTANSAIIAGQANTVSHVRSVIVGGTALTSSMDDEVVVPNLTVASTTGVSQFVIANYGNLDFADDSAAATGGVPLGGVYHNSGALRIRIA